MDISMADSQTSSNAGQSTRLDNTLRALQDMVKEQQALLDEVCAAR